MINLPFEKELDDAEVRVKSVYSDINKREEDVRYFTKLTLCG